MPDSVGTGGTDSVGGRDCLIFALDVADAASGEALCQQLGDHVGLFKVGVELFTAEGPALVERLGKTWPIFLDLKLHDVPATVERACRVVATLPGVKLLTVHAAGGEAMLRAAVKAAAPVKVLAVTVLTSLADADLAAIGAVGPTLDLVERRARLARDAGCAGVICSPQEAERVRAACPPPFLIVTPGVRPSGGETHDQKRVATAGEALRAGADLVVVGRPIRDAADRVEAARALGAELERARR
jgi:orotidine-5'-phosphate decarboxylase